MLHQFSRNELAIGKEGLETLKNSTVAVLGVGGSGRSRRKLSRGQASAAFCLSTKMMSTLQM
ncbi:tRNA threonylcarbamoyladenosine dehydratase [Bacillus subtilis subsp. subtilis]|nr:tRNA threonylcarbamoyladenosine dehydratase [Bacillus subtilis subsp. subtilis]